MTYAWSLSDPATSETYTFPINPNAMTAPFPTRKVASWISRTYKRPLDGFPVIMLQETLSTPTDWQFSGVILAQQMFLDLTTWTNKRDRVHLTDHLGRTFEIQFRNFDATPMRRRHSPWAHQYTIKAYVFAEL